MEDPAALRYDLAIAALLGFADGSLDLGQSQVRLLFLTTGRIFSVGESR